MCWRRARVGSLVRRVGCGGGLEQVEEALWRRVVAREVYQELLGGGGGDVIEAEDADVLGGDRRGMGVDLEARTASWSEPMWALAKVFEDAGGVGLRCSEVCERLGVGVDHNQVGVVRHRCQRLLERGVLESAGRGLYRYAPVGGGR